MSFQSKLNFIKKNTFIFKLHIWPIQHFRLIVIKSQRGTSSKLRQHTLETPSTHGSGSHHLPLIISPHPCPSLLISTAHWLTEYCAKSKLTTDLETRGKNKLSNTRPPPNLFWPCSYVKIPFGHICGFEDANACTSYVEVLSQAPEPECLHSSSEVVRLPLLKKYLP